MILNVKLPIAQAVCRLLPRSTGVQTRPPFRLPLAFQPDPSAKLLTCNRVSMRAGISRPMRALLPGRPFASLRAAQACQIWIADRAQIPGLRTLCLCHPPSSTVSGRSPALRRSGRRRAGFRFHRLLSGSSTISIRTGHRAPASASIHPARWRRGAQAPDAVRPVPENRRGRESRRTNPAAAG